MTALQLINLRGETGTERERAVIERQFNHLSRLVEDLLDVARIARGGVELKSEVVDMAEVAAKAIEIASPWLPPHPASRHLTSPSADRRRCCASGPADFIRWKKWGPSAANWVRSARSRLLSRAALGAQHFD